VPKFTITVESAADLTALNFAVTAGIERAKQHVANIEDAQRAGRNVGESADFWTTVQQELKRVRAAAFAASVVHDDDAVTVSRVQGLMNRISKESS
jgi:hypothetical protein